MPISPLIESTQSRRRWVAFLITTAAAFVLLCSLWPLSIKGFRSSTALKIDRSVDKSDEQLREELSQAVLAETGDEQLQSAIEEIEKSGNLRSGKIEYRDFQTMRESLRIGLFEDQSARHYRIAYEGEGGSDERQLVDMLTYRVAKRLNLQTGSSENLGESFEQLDWIVGQMESDLGFVKQALKQLDNRVDPLGSDNELTLEESSSLDAEPGSFHLVSSKRNTAVTVDDIESSVESIDVENLRNVISGLKSNLSDETGQLTSSPGNGSSRFQGFKSSKTLPINGVPSVPFLLLLGGFSAMIGSAVAWHYDPFSQRGFIDTSNIRSRLKVPVIGTLNLKSPHHVSPNATDGDTAVENAGSERLANRLVRYAALFLIITTAVVFTFMLFNAEIRSAFFENPFFGAAKIVSAFVGK